MFWHKSSPEESSVPELSISKHGQYSKYLGFSALGAVTAIPLTFLGFSLWAGGKSYETKVDFRMGSDPVERVVTFDPGKLRNGLVGVEVAAAVTLGGFALNQRSKARSKQTPTSIPEQTQASGEPNPTDVRIDDEVFELAATDSGFFTDGLGYGPVLDTTEAHPDFQPALADGSIDIAD